MNIDKIKPWIERSSIVSIAPAVDFGARFARTIILSRFLASDEFGVGVAISVMLGIASLVTDVAIDKFAVIEADENGTEALAAAHMLSVVRGALLSLVLVVTAPSTAAMFGVAEFKGAFAIAAFVPLIASFAHLGIKQIQRHYNYIPETWALLWSNLTSIGALLLSIVIFGDHRAVVASFLVEAIVYVCASHILAQTRYRLKNSRALMRKALTFGIPLMLNGIGLALMAQFDRAMVGHWLGVDMLAKYSVLLSISVVPISPLLRVFGALSISFILSKISEDASKSDKYSSLIFLFAVLGVVYSLAIALTLDWATPLIFGHSFVVDLRVHLLLTAIVFFRLQRGGAPTNLLLASGRTRELALLNLSAVVGIVLAFVLLYWSPRLEMLLWGLAIGDMFAFLLSVAASSFIFSLNKTHLTIDLGMAATSLAMIIGMLAYCHEVSLVARTILFVLGTFGLALQIAVGLRIHPDLV